VKQVIGRCELCNNKVIAEFDPQTGQMLNTTQFPPTCEFCRAEMLVELPVIKMQPAPTPKGDNILAFKTRP
jgi:hypothetical protein